MGAVTLLGVQLTREENPRVAPGLVYCFDFEAGFGPGAGLGPVVGVGLISPPFSIDAG